MSGSGQGSQVPGKPGRKWAPLQGEFAEVRALAEVLRDVVDGHGLTLRDLESRMPYGHTAISENLNGTKRPSWVFLAAFVDACAGRDRRARAVLEGRIRALWEAAAPGQATLIPVTGRRGSDAAVPTDLQAWISSLRETAVAQRTVASLQMSVSRHIELVGGLTQMLVRLSAAVQVLEGERDALREELRAQASAADELSRMRDLIDETQRRLDVAEALQAETSRRLDDALGQLREAKRIKEAALAQAERARTRLVCLGHHATAFAALVRNEANRQRLASSDAPLMEVTDQAVATEFFRRADDVLGEEAVNLHQLQEDVAAAADNSPLSAGHPGTRSADIGTGGILQSLSLAKRVGSTGWWSQYADIIPEWFHAYVALEQTARSVRVYENLLIPGLLQTPQYAAAILKLTGMPSDELDRHLALRLQRQRRVAAGDLRVRAIIDEAAFRRPVGSAQILLGQLRYLLSMSDQPNITLQMVPLGTPYSASNTFSILRFSDPDIPDVAYAEQMTSAVYYDKAADMDRYRLAMDRLSAVSTTPKETQDILRMIIRELTPRPATET